MTTLDLDPRRDAVITLGRPRVAATDGLARAVALVETPPAAAPEDTVWVVHRHPVMRRGIAAALGGAGARVLGEAPRLVARDVSPAVRTVVFDGVHAAVEVAADLGRHRDVHLICLIAEPADADLQAAAGAGVAAILLQDDLTPDLLAETWLAALAGRTVLPRHLLPQLLARAATLSSSGVHRLTPRETAVLRLLAEGEDTRAIGVALNYSERTVKNVVHDVLTKLDCRTRAQAVGIATRAGLI